MLLRICLWVWLCLFWSCGPATPANKLPIDDAPVYYQRHPLDASGQYFLKDSLAFLGKYAEGPEGQARPIRDWTYVNQLQDTVTNQDLRGKVYVADFFFTSCPTICPKVKSQMLRLQEQFGQNPDFKLVSFTVDPKRDTPEALKTYADKLGVEDHQQWWFLYGDRLQTYELDADYLSIATENPDAPGGFDHSGYLILVDQNGYVRSYASGIDPSEVTLLMDDIALLLDKKQ